MDTKAIETIIQQEKQFEKDSIAFNQYLLPLTKSQNTEHQIIYNTMRGNNYCYFYGKRDKRTDEYYKNAIKLASQKNNIPLIIWANLNYANYFYKYGEYELMTEPLLIAMVNMNKIPEKELLEAYKTYRFIGFVLHTMKDYEESRFYLEKSLDLTDKNSKEYADALDFVGQSYLMSNELKEAEKFFRKSLKYSQSSQNHIRTAKTYGNIGELYLIQGKFDSAISYVKKDLDITKKLRNEEKNTMYALVLLSKIYLKKNEISNAEHTLNVAESIAKSKPHFKSSEKEILELQLQIYSQKAETGKELEIRRRIDIINDSISLTDGEKPTNNLYWNIQKSKYEEQLAHSSQETNRQKLLKNLFSLFCIFASVSTIYFYINYRKNKKNYLLKVKYYEAERIKIEQQLQNSSLNLDSQISFIHKKNTQIQKLNYEIEHESKTIERREQKLHSLLKSHLITEDNWTNFKTAFINENKEIYEIIQTQFPEITESNLRIIFLQKLGYNNHEISGLLGITQDAIKKSKQRLRKKLSDKYPDLENLISL
ncbi:MAG: tetratricopeptide repeat protein [Cruoricaptor ignavus]|nr:tetratricopeptide repeat protein [Cruoricaptor ignavus]